MGRIALNEAETDRKNDPVSHLRALKKSLGDLNADAAARLVSAASDIALVLDGDGIIEEVTVGNDDLPRDEVSKWVGRPWIDTVTSESRHKVKELLSEAASKAITRSRQVNHPSLRGADLPVRYAALQIGQTGRVVALGRELRSLAQLQQHLVDAQQSMEREYARLRHAETRYRLLFQKSSEAVLIVDVAGLRIVEANPAATQLLGRPAKRLVGRPFLELLEPVSSQAAQEMVAAARTSGQAADIQVKVLAATGEGKASEITISPSMFRQSNAAHFLMRLSPTSGSIGSGTAVQGNRALSRVVESMPDGFVVTSLEQSVLVTNSAFLDLAQLASPEQARGGQLDQWVGRSSVELNGLIANLKEHGAARSFTTIVRGQYGSVEDVEISAVAVMGGADPCFGFTIRPLGRKLAASANTGRELPHSTKQLTELVGRVPMKNIVRDTTDLIEKLCIEAALELAGDNRVSAAEMLGLSRQSLYVKLRRYGIVDPGSDDV